MKRILSLFLSCVFVIGIAFSTPIIASAEEAPTIANLTISGKMVNGKYWSKAGESVTVTPPEGYYIAKVENDETGEFSPSVTFTSSDTEMKVQLKKVDTQEITDIIIIDNIAFDAVDPTGEIQFEGKSWTTSFEEITFSLFFKTSKTFTIEATDGDSGVASIEYYISTDKIEDVESESITWEPYASQVELPLDTKAIIYARITDNVGKVTYINSDGVVLYTDSEGVTESVSYTYKENADEEVTVKLNGNEINSVTYDEEKLNNSYYSIDGDKITLKASYLDTLNVGEYTYTVSYNPQGEVFVEAVNNEKPETITFKVVVSQAAITGATLPEAITGLVYDGSEHELVSAGHIENGTVQYKLSKEDEWSNAVPKGTDADDYTVYYKISLDANHTDITGTVPVTIAKANSTVTVIPEANDLTYNGEVQSLIKEGEADGGVIYYSVNGGEWKTEVPTATNAGDYTVDYKVIGNKNYNDADSDSICVKIKQQPITITAEDKSIYVNQVIPNLTYTQKGLVSGHTIKLELNTNFNLDDPVVGDYPIIQDGEVVIKNSNDVVVTDNYDITFKSGNLTVENCTGHKGGTATCYAKAVCENCGASYGEMKPHTIGTKIEKYPNCLVEGESKKYCKNEGCKYFVFESIEVDPDNHDWANGTRETTTKPTCKTEGVCTITCANGCGKTATEAIPVVADAHVLSGWAETPATCVKEGEKSRVCMEEGCDYKETEVVEINKDAHDMTGEWEVVKEVTCVTDGEKELKCKNEGCTHKITEVVKADGVSHNLTGWQITVEPKCTVEGELAKLCKNEGCTYKETSSLDIVVDNHDPAEEFTVVPATCISAGEKYKVCKNPDCTAKLELEELLIDPEAHVNTEVLNAKEPTCLETGYTGDTFCKDCEKIIVIGVTVDAKGHTASEWIVDKEATFEEDGAQHKECTVCKEELQKAVIEKRSLDTPVVKIENDGKGVKVTWSQDEDSAGYTVYRSTYNAKTKKWSKWVNRGTADASKTSWVDKKVENGVTYKYTVRAVNDKYKSAYKETSSLLYIVAPKVTCSITSTGILVNWNKIDNADSYDVYRSVLVDGVWVKWAKIGTTKAAKNTFLDDKVESGVNYKYTVRVVDGKVKSGYVSSASIIYLSQPVLKISNSANGVTGSWAKVEGATGYTIYRSEYNTSTKKWTKWLNLGTTKETAKSFTDKTVKSGYKYKYTIRAINGELKSTYVDSNQLIFLAQPTLKIANTAAGIQGKWDKVDGATGYILYRSELKEDGSWTKWLTLGTAKATAKSFTDKTVKSGVTYKYTIRAKNGNYKSSYVDSNSSIFLSIPTVKIANSETGVKVSWGKIDGATNYLVYRCELKNGKWTKWKELETVDTTSFVDETAVSNVKYKYTVRALNGDFRSYYTSSTELLYLAAPTVTADKIDEGIKVSWNKIDGATSYIIYRSELIEDGKWSKWTKLGTAGEKYTSCKDKTVKEDVVYKYTVRAVNGKLMSYYVASEQILNGVVTESTPEEPKTDVVA